MTTSPNFVPASDQPSGHRLPRASETLKHVLRAIEAGWPVALGSVEELVVVMDSSGAVLALNASNAQETCASYPSLQAVIVLGVDIVFPMTALRFESEAYLQAVLVGLDRDPFQTASIVVGSVAYLLFASEPPFEGVLELGTGVSLMGRGALVPLPGTLVHGEVAELDDALGYAPLPSAIVGYLEGLGGDEGADRSPLETEVPTEDRPLPATDAGGEDAPTELESDPEALNSASTATASRSSSLEGPAVACDSPPAFIDQWMLLTGAMTTELAPVNNPAEVPAILARYPKCAPSMCDLVARLAQYGDSAFAQFLIVPAREGLLLTSSREGYTLGGDLLWTEAQFPIRLMEMGRETVAAVDRAYPVLLASKEERAAIQKSLRRYHTAAGLKAVIELVTTHAELYVESKALDLIPGLISVRNGVVDPATKSLRERRAADYLTRAAIVPWTPGSRCPVFEDLLVDIFDGDALAANFLLKYIGYSLLGTPRLKKMLIVVGPGDSGKSLLFAVLAQVLGSVVEYAHRRVMFCLGEASSTDPHTVRLLGARLVVVSESRQNEILDDTAIKSMTGGVDPLILRGLYSAPIRFIPTWSFVLVTNFMPRLPDDDPALVNRLEFVRFTKSSRPRDPQLFDKLMAEAEGILCRVIDAAHEYLRDGLDLPPSLHSLRLEILATAKDPLSQFFDENLILDTDTRVSAEAVRDRAREWFATRGFAVPSQKAIGDRVRVLFDAPQVDVLKSRGVMVYRGLKLRETGEDSVPVA